MTWENLSRNLWDGNVLVCICLLCFSRCSSLQCAVTGLGEVEASPGCYRDVIRATGAIAVQLELNGFAGCLSFVLVLVLVSDGDSTVHAKLRICVVGVSKRRSRIARDAIGRHLITNALEIFLDFCNGAYSVCVHHASRLRANCVPGWTRRQPQPFLQRLRASPRQS